MVEDQAGLGIIPKITDKDSFDGFETDIRVGEHRRAMLKHRSRISTPSGGRFPSHPSRKIALAILQVDQSAGHCLRFA
jgi:hypothetical protein